MTDQERRARISQFLDLQKIPGGSMNKKILIMVGAAILIFACGSVPSDAAIQTALVQTQAAGTEMQNAIQSYIAQTQAAWTPTSGILPPSLPTNMLLPTTSGNNNITKGTVTPGSNCIFWENVTASMEGQNVCVYGRVTDVVPQDNGMYFYFENSGTSFYLILLKQGSVYLDFPDVQIGDCVQTNGTIKTYLGIPRIETENTITYWYGDKYTCE